MSQGQIFLRACHTSWQENSWHRYGTNNYVTVTLCVTHASQSNYSTSTPDLQMWGPLLLPSLQWESAAPKYVTAAFGQTA